MQCPSCDLPMQSEAVCGEILERCGQCGGEFSTHQTLRRLLAAHTPAPGARGEAYSRPSPLSDPMRYRKCPACCDMMMRKNFRDSSGIVIDVCSAHGVWFDGGELAMVFEFAATGAMAKAEHDSAERAEARKKLNAFERRLVGAGPFRYAGSLEFGYPLAALADISLTIPEDD